MADIGKHFPTFFVLISFIFVSRPKFFYYLCIYALHFSLVGFMKIIYARPRPFMITSEITPLQCSKSFGNPSGHSHNAAFFTLVLFLDIFHGRTLPFKTKPAFFNRFEYCVGLCIMLFCMITIPTSRFVLGAHSLDQILFGFTLGIWSAILLHFRLRDNLMAFVDHTLKQSI